MKSMRSVLQALHSLSWFGVPFWIWLVFILLLPLPASSQAVPAGATLAPGAVGLESSPVHVLTFAHIFSR